MSVVNLQDAVKQFLLDYRTTPYRATNQTSEKLFLRWEVKTRFSLLRPEDSKDHIYDTQNRPIINYRDTRSVNFKVGDSVGVTDYREGKINWTKAKIIKEIVPGVTYLVEAAPDVVWKRHSNQMHEMRENKNYMQIVDEEENTITR